jgi:hypothetical protein
MAQGRALRIGVDLDNTLVLYDRVLRRLAHEAGLIRRDFTGSKREVRDQIRSLADGEAQWMQLQAAIYGTRMGEAEFAEGAEGFLAACREARIAVYIVSHKTQFAAVDRDRLYDLHRSALAWMENAGFFAPRGFGIARASVYFESSREAKCRRIAELRCTHFIDDLVEVFEHPDFPQAVERHLYLPESGAAPAGPFRVHRTWSEITDAILAPIRA